MNLDSNPSNSPGDCGRFEQDLFLYLHDALSSSSRLRVEAHVAHCSACQKRMEAFTAVSKQLSEAVRGEDMAPWTPRSMPPRLWRRLPWYTPLIIFMFIGGLSLIAVEYGVTGWVAERIGGAPHNNFSEKTRTHSLIVSPSPCLDRFRR